MLRREKFNLERKIESLKNAIMDANPEAKIERVDETILEVDGHKIEITNYRDCKFVITNL